MSSYVYTTYIRTTPEKLWAALTTPEFQKQYWFGMHQESDFTKGADWKLCFSDGRVADAGEILESEPPKRLVMTWRNEFRPELKEEGHARCSYDLEPLGETVKLTVTHTSERENSKVIEAVSGGWPKVLSSLKSLLETGTALPEIHQPPKA